MNNAVRKIAIKRINDLFELAEKKMFYDEVLAQNYADLARKIAMTARVSLPKKHRIRICRNCKNYLLPGKNCFIRVKKLREPHLTITCKKCDNKMRYNIKSRERKLS